MIDNLKIVVNYFYNPVDEFKEWVDKNAGKDSNFVLVRGGADYSADSEWDAKHSFRDNLGEDNVSKLNYTLSELTGIYWTWKHYDMIGNPLKIGMCHYRRLWNLDDIKDLVGKYDIICNDATSDDGRTVYEQYAAWHVEDDMKRFFNCVNPAHRSQFEKYVKEKKLYHQNMMFVCNRGVFFYICEKVFNALFAIIAITGENELKARTAYQSRMAAFLGERLFSFYFDKLQQEGYSLVKSKYDYHKEWQAANKAGRLSSKELILGNR